MTDDWKKRLTGQLEPILMQPDPRPQISAYHDMPYAIFRLFARGRVRRSKGRSRCCVRGSNRQASASRPSHSRSACKQASKPRIWAPPSSPAPRWPWACEATIETVHEVLSSYEPLDDLVARRLPEDAEPLRDIVFIVRAGALFPMYRTSSLLEQLKGKVHVPAVLFYPGELDGAAGLRFMGVLDAEHNYRPKIF